MKREIHFRLKAMIGGCWANSFKRPWLYIYYVHKWIGLGEVSAGGWPGDWTRCLIEAVAVNIITIIDIFIMSAGQCPHRNIARFKRYKTVLFVRLC